MKCLILHSPRSITTQLITQGGDRRHKEIVPAPHLYHLLKFPQPWIHILLIWTMQRRMQQLLLRLRLPNEGIIARARSRECGGVAPGLLDELEAVLETALIASEEETSFLRGCFRGEFASVGDAAADHAGHFHGVGVGAGVGFADVGAERAGVFGDAFEFEVVFVSGGLVGGVFGWEECNRCSCRREYMSGGWKRVGSNERR